MNAGVVGQEGTRNGKDFSTDRGNNILFCDPHRTICGMDPAKAGERDRSALQVRRSIQSMDELNSAFRQAKVLDSTGLKFRTGYFVMVFSED